MNKNEKILTVIAKWYKDSLIAYENSILLQDTKAVQHCKTRINLINDFYDLITNDLYLKETYQDITSEIK